MRLIALTTPEGKISINVDFIVGISQCNLLKGQNDTIVQTKIWKSNSEESFNILESYDAIIKMITSCQD